MILDVERAWGKSPGWFSSLDEETQTKLLGWWKVKNEHQANP